MIFVFGSNLSGIHGAGSAKYAFENHGAVWGEGDGRTGNAYAIATKDFNVYSTLTLDQIHHNIDKFLAYANAHDELDFKVTCVGCGYAGLRHSQVAPMFHVLPNLKFDLQWKPYLADNAAYWGTFQ